MTDIITSIIETCVEQIPAMTEEIARSIELTVRSRWGGEQAYISKRAAMVDAKRQLINDELRAGRSVKQIEELHDIPRTTIYRIINNKSRN